MQTFSIIASLLLASSSLVAALSPPVCGTCNPVSGENHCDVTTSCINTGKRFHCACRAGYKATKNNDPVKQFRLNIPNYQHLIFVPEFTTCNVLCNDPFAPPAQLCSEVALQPACPV